MNQADLYDNLLETTNDCGPITVPLQHMDNYFVDVISAGTVYT